MRCVTTTKPALDCAKPEQQTGDTSPIFTRTGRGKTACSPDDLKFALASVTIAGSCCKIRGCDGKGAGRSSMTNTLLTLHDPATARRYYADGVWQGDTLYALLQKQSRQRGAAFCAARPRRGGSPGRSCWRWVDAVAADFHAAGVGRTGRTSFGVAAQPRRGRGDAGCSPARATAMSATPRSIAELHGRRGGGAVEFDPVELRSSRKAAGASMRRSRGYLRGRVSGRFRRCGASMSWGGAPRDYSRARPRRSAAARGREQSRQGDLSGLHLGHHGQAQGRAAFRQHAARQRPRHGRRLAP